MLPLAVGAMITHASAASSSQQAMTAITQPDDIQAKITAEIRAKARGRIKTYYKNRGFVPLWAASGKIGVEADILLGFLATAELDGLKSSSYKIERLRKLIAEAETGDPRRIARAELELSNAFSRYVGDLRRPTKFIKTYLNADMKPKKLKPEMILGAASLPRFFTDYVSSMGWMNPHYARIRILLAEAIEQGNSAEVVRRLRLNLERAQALPGPWTHHIVVDSASGRLWYYQAGKQYGTMRVIVGKPESPTPMLSGMLQYAILNPYWNVPIDLVQKNIAPKILAGRSLRSMGMEALSDWSLSAYKLDPANINWVAVAAGTQELRLRQLPGTSNSMGRVKFMFPNDLGIYLHDTPERDLFNKVNRHLSNGCIRLEGAQNLGEWLLGKSIKMASKEPEQVVSLPAPIPVYLTYFSATKTNDGIEFLPDIYGRDTVASDKP
jgi:L,D-transpeptidase YcbB